MNRERLMDRARLRLRSRMQPAGDCLEWTGPRNGHGYGVFRVGHETHTAHRWTYMLFVGPVDSDLEVDHRCYNPSCVKLAHLEVVTKAENMRRRRKPPRPTACPKGHIYNVSNTAIAPAGYIYCKTCNREKQAARRQLKKVA